MYLKIKQAEIERSVDKELTKISRINARLENYDNKKESYAVVIKSIDPIEFLHFREVCVNPAQGREATAAMLSAVNLEKKSLSNLMYIIQMPGFELTDIDVKIGFIAKAGAPKMLAFPYGKNEITMRSESLPKVENAATLIYSGAVDDSFSAYRAIAEWIEAGGYKIAGKWREVMLEIPRSFDEVHMEIQVPIEVK